MTASARATLERIQGFGKTTQSPGDQESDNLAEMEIQDEGTESAPEAKPEEKPPF